MAIVCTYRAKTHSFECRRYLMQLSISRALFIVLYRRYCLPLTKPRRILFVSFSLFFALVQSRRRDATIVVEKLLQPFFVTIWGIAEVCRFLCSSVSNLSLLSFFFFFLNYVSLFCPFFFSFLSVLR